MNAMKATVSITTTAWASLRRTKASNRAVMEAAIRALPDDAQVACPLNRGQTRSHARGRAWPKRKAARGRLSVGRESGQNE